MKRSRELDEPASFGGRVNDLSVLLQPSLVAPLYDQTKSPPSDWGGKLSGASGVAGHPQLMLSSNSNVSMRSNFRGCTYTSKSEYDMVFEDARKTSQRSVYGVNRAATPDL